MIKALPATYDGIEYRSRTEARWARFFDLASIRFEYEREGYETPLGWYVPDFWLPDSGCWIEIKGSDENHDQHMRKLMAVCEATNSYGFVFVGSPKEMRGSFVGQDLTESSGGTTGSRFDAGIASGGRQATETFRVDLGRRDRDFYDANMSKVLDCVWLGDYREEWEESGIKDAALAASKYRFW